MHRHVVNASDTTCAETVVGRDMYTDIGDLWRMSYRDIRDDILHRRNNIVLRFNIINGANVKDICTGLGTHIRKVPTRYIWEWLHNYICQHLLLKCDKVVGKGRGGRRYEYHIDLSNWIYYYIRSIS